MGQALSWNNPIDWLEYEELWLNIYFSNLSNEVIINLRFVSQDWICVNEPLTGVNGGLSDSEPDIVIYEPLPGAATTPILPVDPLPAPANEALLSVYCSIKSNLYLKFLTRCSTELKCTKFSNKLKSTLISALKLPLITSSSNLFLISEFEVANSL